MSQVKQASLAPLALFSLSVLLLAPNLRGVSLSGPSCHACHPY